MLPSRALDDDGVTRLALLLDFPVVRVGPTKAEGLGLGGSEAVVEEEEGDGEPAAGERDDRDLGEEVASGKVDRREGGEGIRNQQPYLCPFFLFASFSSSSGIRKCTT